MYVGFFLYVNPRLHADAILFTHLKNAQSRILTFLVEGEKNVISFTKQMC